MSWRQVSTQQQVFEAIQREREYQDRKWGTLDTYRHVPDTWLDIVQEEVREAVDASDQREYRQARCELLQAAAVIVAYLEQHGVAERTK